MSEEEKQAVRESVPQAAAIPQTVAESAAQGDGNPDSNNPNLCWKNAEGDWVYNGTGYKNPNPAHVKAHVRGKLGQEGLDRLTFHSNE